MLAALSVLGGLLLLGDWIVDFLAPVVGDAAARGARRCPALVITPDRGRWSSRSASALAWFLVGKRDVPREAPDARSRSSPGPPAPTSTATRSTTRSSSSPGQRSSPGWSPSTARSSTAAVEGTASAVGGVAGRLRLVQNGFVRSYALSLLGGALLVVLALLAVNLA